MAKLQNEPMTECSSSHHLQEDHLRGYHNLLWSLLTNAHRTSAARVLLAFVMSMDIGHVLCSRVVVHCFYGGVLPIVADSRFICEQGCNLIYDVMLTVIS